MNKLLTALKQSILSAFSFLRLNKPGNSNDIPALKNLSSDEKRICVDAGRGGYDGEKSDQMYVDQWSACCDLEANNAVKEITEELALIKAQKANTDEDRDMFTKAERIKNASIDLKEEKDKALFKLKKAARATERMLERITKEIAIITGIIIYLKTFHKNLPIKKTFWDTVRGLLVISLGVTLLESVFTIPALQTGGFDNGIAWLTSLLLSSVIGISCHFAGESYSQSSRRTFILWLGIGLTVIGVIVYWRRHADDNLALSVSNLVIFVAGILLSIRRHRNNYYFDLLEKRAELESQEDKLTSELELQDAEEIKIENDYKTRAEKLANAHINDLEAQEAELYKRNTILLAQRQNILKEIEGKKQSGILNIKQSFEKGYNERYTRINKKWGRSTVSIILIVLALSCASCSHKSDSNIELMLSSDRSGSLRSVILGKDEDFIKLYESEVFKLDKSDKGIRVYFSSVGASSYPVITKIELPPPPPYLLRNERKRQKQIALFREQFRAGIRNTFRTAANEPYTNLARSLAFQLQHLKNSDYGGNKVYYIWSDCLEFSWVDDFEKYKGNPALLDSNYSQIANRMNKHSPFPDLTGITVCLCYIGVPNKDELIHAAFRYWQRYLTGRGAKVEIFSSL